VDCLPVPVAIVRPSTAAMWQPVTHCGLTFMRPRRRLWLAGNRPREMDMTNPTGVKIPF